jgi:hypothetical protein
MAENQVFLPMDLKHLVANSARFVQKEKKSMV